MDKVTIEINCDRNTVSIDPHPGRVIGTGMQAHENCRAGIIARIVSPQIRILMAMPIAALNEKYLDLLSGKLPID